jgi:hypothetical protein
LQHWFGRRVTGLVRGSPAIAKDGARFEYDSVTLAAVRIDQVSVPPKAVRKMLENFKTGERDISALAGLNEFASSGSLREFAEHLLQKETKGLDGTEPAVSNSKVDKLVDAINVLQKTAKVEVVKELVSAFGKLRETASRADFQKIAAAAGEKVAELVAEKNWLAAAELKTGVVESASKAAK